MAIRLTRWVGAAVAALGLSACGVLAPLPRSTTVEERLAMLPTTGLPLKGRVTVRWNDQMVPFIEAEHDEDLAVALGVIHAHLRLGQMEVGRRAARGRIAEMGGPLATDIDHALRIIDFGKATPQVVASMPADSRAWLDGFVRGLNHYVATTRELPHEFAVLGLEREPWTAEDVLTVGRLASSDVNWFVWFALLKQRNRPDWPQVWERLVGEGTMSVPSHAAGQTRDFAALQDLLVGMSRSGSNSVAVTAQKSTSGGALIASDPHLGVTLPNLWLVAGYKSPSYHAVGLMPAGLPFLAIGRNERIAWGGTNLRAASSDLFDVSSLPADQFRLRAEKIRVRFWFDRTVQVRETALGPVISDAPMIDMGGAGPLAIRWIGHSPTDELNAMLRLNRAGNWDEFRAALDGFAISAQNMIYADIDGNIGHVMAAHLPKRPNAAPADLVTPFADAGPWDEIVTGASLPVTFNPPGGVIASANNRGAEADVPIGYFFSPNDRVLRLASVLEKRERVSAAELGAIQRDTFQISSLDLRDVLVARARREMLADALPADQRALFDRMAGWDGYYSVASPGAPAFEIFLFHFVAAFFDAQQRSVYGSTGRPFSFYQADIEAAPADRFAAAFRAALAAAAPRATEVQAWGDMHRLSLGHPLGFIPVLGRRYQIGGDIPTGGSSNTVMKTAHDLTDQRHFTRYGSNARHVSDMADPDANFFTLLGGQDGWFNSAAFNDQSVLWRDGAHVQVPMRPESVRASFRHVTVLSP